MRSSPAASAPRLAPSPLAARGDAPKRRPRGEGERRAAPLAGRKPRRRAERQCDARAPLTPQVLAAARARGRAQREIRPRANMKPCARWSGSTPGSSARAIGFVAIDIETASIDPMQAELCGFSLAVAPNEACYVPLSHRQGGEGGRPVPRRHRARPDCRARGARRPQAAARRRGVLKIGHEPEIRLADFGACAASRSRRTTTPC